MLIPESRAHRQRGKREKISPTEMKLELDGLLFSLDLTGEKIAPMGVVLRGPGQLCKIFLQEGGNDVVDVIAYSSPLSP